MKADKIKRYRFTTEAQWSKCLFVQSDGESLRKGHGVRPFAPYARPATLHESRGAHAPVITAAHEILWLDDNCAINRLANCDDMPEQSAAPLAIARATRIVGTGSGLWVKSDSPESLERYEDDSLTRLSTVKIAEAKIIDIASDGDDSIWALISSHNPSQQNPQEREELFQAIRVDRFGHIVEAVNFRDVSKVSAFVFLPRSKRFVVLAADPEPRLYWFPKQDDQAGFGVAAIFSLPVGGLRPCFVAHALGSDSSDKVFLTGADGREFGGKAHVLILDGDGDVLGELPLDAEDAPATGVAADRDSLVVTGRRGLLQFKVAEVVPEGAGQVQCMLMTPLLFSRDREDQRRWLRVEATASLPEGSTLEISWTATDDDAATRDRLTALAMDQSFTASQVLAQVLNEPNLHRGQSVFHGVAGSAPQAEKSVFSAPLFDVSERYLWVCVTLTVAHGARLPALFELAVLYPGRTLMEDLPAIYQKEEQRPNSFLRALVGVLETTTQDLDSRIGAMGQQIHPLTAPEPWLDFIARWLGVPWDEALTLNQKRAVVMRAPDIANGRGTRAGLEALLEALIPGSPRRFRVTDTTADFGFAVVGGESCAGSALPAMLGGRTRWNSELNSRAVLGYVRLPCPGQLDDGAWQLAGKVQVRVEATAAERKAWSPWLLALINEMVPLTARVTLIWTTASALRNNRLDGTMRLESPPNPHLGTDAITGLAHLPKRGVRLSDCGPTIGTTLR
jgi:phage tail-like protein